MTTRTVNIALIEAVPQVRQVKFKPRLASVDGGALLQQVYTCTTNSSGVGSIALPVKTGGSIRYDYEIPKVGGKSIGYFVLAPGSAVNLEDLIAAGGMPSDSTIDYIDAAIAGITGGTGVLKTRGSYNASGNVFPSTGGSGTAGAIKSGDLWIISTGGTLGGSAVTANDLIWALVDTPGQTASNWSIVEQNIGYVPQQQNAALTSISGLSPSNDDFLQRKAGAWANRTVAQVKTDLGLTGTNSGDQFDDRINIRQALGSTTKAETWPLERLAAVLTLTDNRMELQAVWLPVASTITGVKWWQAVQGAYTADQNNKVGLYTYSGGTLTLVASCANDGNLWKAATQSFASKAFSTPYAAAAGLYFIAMLYNQSAQTTAPQLVAGNSAYVATGGSADYTNNAKAMGFVTSLNDLPATQAMSGVSSLGIPVYAALY